MLLKLRYKLAKALMGDLVKIPVPKGLKVFPEEKDINDESHTRGNSTPWILNRLFCGKCQKVASGIEAQTKECSCGKRIGKEDIASYREIYNGKEWVGQIKKEWGINTTVPLDEYRKILRGS